MIEITYICDGCKVTHGPLKTSDLPIPTKPKGWRRGGGLLRCEKCWNDKEVNDTLFFSRKGPYWICPSCFKVLNDTHRRAKTHFPGLSCNATGNPYSSQRKLKGRKCSALSAGKQDLLGPFNLSRCINEDLLVIYRKHAQAIRDDPSISQEWDRKYQAYRFNVSYDKWPEERTEALRRELHAFISKLGDK